MAGKVAPRCLLISNSTTHPTGYLDHCAEAMTTFLKASNVSSVLFIPFALKDCDAYTAKARDRFKLMGFDVKGLHECDDKIAAVNEAESIFVGGGNTFRLLNLLYKHNVVDAIRARVAGGMPYMGASAGTNVACKSIRTTNDMPIVQPPSFEALALVPIQINPHYLEPDPNSTHKGETRRERLEQFLEDNTTPVLGDKWTVEGKNLPIRVFLHGKDMQTFAVGDDVSFLQEEAKKAAAAEQADPAPKKPKV
ncbi:peptidase E [Salpingoeca rosetta]|uniref:Peptidase E n=1 Tax=Salpingoeca rosetta (strain ATCC 50818 / BSB-021) TaxID=946362 RepID=F2TZB2_SALR5|nr:peptidase E [Salpingoeca rosetta]EGD78936.1 peptidase E [Salpingoeca rosetta]|eukprot:XP_004997892.1 peptidase E [Salpingoeca rosetta]